MKKLPFFTRNAFLILLLAVFVLPITMRGARLALENNKNDVKEWLPDGFEETKELEWFGSHFMGEQFVIASWKGCTLDDPRLEMLVKKLTPEGDSIQAKKIRAFFKNVTTGPRVLEQMTDPSGPLKLSRKEAVRRLTGTLIGADGETTCLIALLTKDATKDLRAGLGNARPLPRILMGREDGLIYQMADECAIPKAAMIMGGPPVDNVAIDDEGEITMMRLVGLSAIVGLCIAYYCFRSKRATLMVFCCGVYAASASLMVVYFTGGLVDAVLMSMPSLVYVLGLSGAIHLVNYYKDTVEEEGLEGAPGRALRHGWLPCTLAAVTTALGLGSLYTSEVIPIRKFGTYSAVGVMFTLIILFTLLPVLLQLFPLGQEKTKKKRPAPRRSDDSAWSRQLVSIADWIIHHRTKITVSCTLFMVVLAAGVFKTQTTVQLLKLFDSNVDIIHDYTWLENNLGNLVPMEVVVRLDKSRMRDSSDPVMSDDGKYRLTFLERMEMVKHVQRNIERLPEVGRTLSMVTFAPVMPESRGSVASFAERSGFNAGLAHHREQFLKEDYFRETSDGEELYRVSARLAALSDTDYGVFVDQIRAMVQPVLAAYRDRDRILETLSEPGQSLRGKRVCVIGVPRPASSASASTADKALPLPHDILAETLADLLKVAGVKVTHVYQADADYRPRHVVAANEHNAKAEQFFGAFDLVYLAKDHPSVASAFIARHANELIDVRSTELVNTDREVARASGLSPVYTGVVPLVYKAQRTLLTGLVESMGLAFVLICMVMMMVLRSPSAGLLSMIPNVFPVVVIFGFMGWVGIAVDIGAMMTASVAMGVAVDDTVHFLTWFRRGMLSGLDRHGAVRLAYQRCATAMLQTTIIGGLGLGVFALSTFTPTQRFGYLMMVLLVAALIGDLLFLPALLAGPVGRWFSAKPKTSKRASAVDSNALSTAPHAKMPAPHFTRPQRSTTTSETARFDRGEK